MFGSRGPGVVRAREAARRRRAEGSDGSPGLFCCEPERKLSYDSAKLPDPSAPSVKRLV